MIFKISFNKFIFRLVFITVYCKAYLVLVRLLVNYFFGVISIYNIRKGIKRGKSCTVKKVDYSLLYFDFKIHIVECEAWIVFFLLFIKRLTAEI